jgi:hypothetical protein
MSAIRRLDRSLRSSGWRCDQRVKTCPIPAGGAACAAQRATIGKKLEAFNNQKLLFAAQKSLILFI